MGRLFCYLIIAWLSMTTVWGAAESTEPQAVTFMTADGGSINALLFGKGHHAVVLAHGAVFNKESWGDFAAALAAQGFTAMALDFRGYGDSKPGSKPDGLYEDILAAVRYLRQHGAVKVSVVGASMGGGAAAKASVAAKPGEIDKLVLLSPATIGRPEHLQGEILFLASQDESMAGSIKAMFEKAPDPKNLTLFEGTAHAQHIFKTEQADKLTALIIEFLKN